MYFLPVNGIIRVEKGELMPALAPTSQAHQNGFSRGNSFGSESLEKQAENQQNKQQEYDQDKKDMNNVWNSFLSTEPSQPVSFTRMDSPSTSLAAENIYQYTAPQEKEEEKKLSFAEIYTKLQSQDIDSGLRQNDSESGHTFDNDKTRDFVGTSEAKEAQPQYVPASIVEENEESSTDQVAEKKQIGSIEFKKAALGTSKEVLDGTFKVAKFGFKEGKTVVNAVKDLWKNFIGFSEKKPDPKAKEKAEKAAKKKAHQQQFIGLLREGISLYYAAMRRALIELEVKLGVNVLSPEDRNQLLGRNRNMSFAGNDSVYAIHQTAYAMAEQKRRQMQGSSGSAAGRGRPSAGQIFRDKNLQGERSGGQNMMSAVG